MQNIHIENKNECNTLPLIGDYAPEFSASSTHGPVNFPSDYSGSWVVFFSHPADFTPVCTTEFLAFQELSSEFNSLNTKLLGLSVDSVNSHLAWLNEIKELVNYRDQEGVEVTFPIIDDIKMDVSKKYGMIHPNSHDSKAVRAVFIICPKGIVRTILYYPMTTGRNMQEILRIVKALHTTDEFSVSTPANWEVGDDVVIGAPKTFDDVLSLSKNCTDGCHSWFLRTKKLDKKEVENKIMN